MELDRVWDQEEWDQVEWDWVELGRVWDLEEWDQEVLGPAALVLEDWDLEALGLVSSLQKQEAAMVLVEQD